MRNQEGMSMPRNVAHAISARATEPVSQPQLLVRFALAVVLAMALALSFQVNRAHAGKKWVGAAIAGAIIGGAIVHHAHKHHYKKRYVRYHRPYVRPVKVYRPVVVVPAPVVVYRPAYVYKPVRVYRHHPAVSFGIRVGW